MNKRSSLRKTRYRDITSISDAQERVLRDKRFNELARTNTETDSLSEMTPGFKAFTIFGNMFNSLFGSSSSSSSSSSTAEPAASTGTPAAAEPANNTEFFKMFKQPVEGGQSGATVEASPNSTVVAKENSYKSTTSTATDGSDQAAVIREANRLGIDPVDLATMMSYETSGSFDPWKKGPPDQRDAAAEFVAQGADPNMRGLIQFGAEEQIKYGIKEGMSFDEQMKAVGDFLEDRGLKRWLEENPDATLEEKRTAMYSTINAGNPNKKHWGLSDADAGGDPNNLTVWDKAQEMFKEGPAGVSHRGNALAFMATPPAEPTEPNASPAPAAGRHRGDKRGEELDSRGTSTPTATEAPPSEEKNIFGQAWDSLKGLADKAALQNMYDNAYNRGSVESLRTSGQGAPAASVESTARKLRAEKELRDAIGQEDRQRELQEAIAREDNTGTPEPVKKGQVSETPPPATPAVGPEPMPTPSPTVPVDANKINNKVNAQELYKPEERSPLEEIAKNQIKNRIGEQDTFASSMKMTTQNQDIRNAAQALNLSGVFDQLSKPISLLRAVSSALNSDQPATPGYVFFGDQSDRNSKK